MYKGFPLKNNLIFLLFISCMLYGFTAFSQEKKPKVALVLSGGGAKGIAHIPLLQALDSLGIVPDLIVGNSMGSVVGGLYAMGYSGDSIANIVKMADWEQLIGGKVSLKNVSVEEKTEFNRYLVELDYVKGKVKLGKFLLNDQNLRQFISTLTFPSYKITDFDQLPIPFRAVATDIVNGKIVVLDHGSLALAMRASMSLPGVFSAVPYNKTLLVDGAILNNFPVDVAKDLGADIIIGSDVGDGLMKIDELENISSLLFQAGMLSSHLINEKNRALCTILINHTEHLTFGTSDFQKNQQIYKEGQMAVADQKKALILLSERLKKHKQHQAHVPYMQEEIKLDTIVYNNINKTNFALVKARTNIQSGKIYTKEELIEGINRAMGTTIFSQITFEPFSKKGKLGLQLNGFERSQHQLKGSLHYDDFHGVGILMNYTGRNILGAASRSLITLDVAETPRFRVQHQKNFGKDRDWWWRTEAYGQQLTQPLFFNNERGYNIRNRYFEFDNQVNRNITSMASYVGFQLNYQYTHLKPKINPAEGDNSFSLDSYSFHTIQIGAHYVYNTFNSIYYATEGTAFKATLTRSLHNTVAVQFSADNLTENKGQVSNFTKVGFELEHRLLFSPTVAGIFGTSGKFILVDAKKEGDLSFYDFGFGAKYALGGNQLDPRRDSYMFAGLNEGELAVTQFTKVNLGVMYNFKPKLYLTPHLDFAVVGFESFNNFTDKVFSASGQWNDFKEVNYVFSSGITVSYNSILGPVNFDVSWVNDLDKVRLFFGVGLQLNRSN